MSDPVSNEDIEDVLSSIRRLVSDEPIKGVPRRKLASVDNVERFVLTPAFRVADEDLAPNTVSDDSTADEDQAHSGSAEPSLEDEVAQDTHARHGDGAKDHQPTQEEIGLQPYQSDNEWVEPKPEQNDRLDANTGEEPRPKHPDPEPLYLEAAANHDEAPFVDVPSEDDPDDVHADKPSPHESHSDDRQDETVTADDFWQDPSEYEPETQPEPEHTQAEDTAEADIEALFEEETSEATAPDTETESSDPEPTAPDPAPHVAGQITLEQRIAELEAALQNSAQEWEPDGSEEELTDETRPLSFGKDARLADAIASVAQTLEKKTPEPDEKWQPSAKTTGPAPIDALYAEPLLDAASASEDEQDDLDDETVEWRDVEQEWLPDTETDSVFDAEDDIEDDEGTANTAAMQAATLAAVKEAARSDRDTDLFAADEPTMLDEEALQELVADIVRQELQGVLGERITRNVRRLVRREIKRALAMRDLE